MSDDLEKGWLTRVFRDVSKEVRRWPKRTCTECHGSKKCTYEVPGDGWDREYEEQTCHSCGGKGTIGGGQPGLQLWFQSKKERDEFKAKILRMRGIKWTDESESVLETQSTPKFKG